MNLKEMSLKEFILAVILLISIISIGTFFIAYPQLPWLFIAPAIFILIFLTLFPRGLLTPDRIRTETNNLIVLDSKKVLNFFIGVTLIAVGGYFFMGRVNSEVKLFFTFCIVFFILWYGGLLFLISGTVTIDKKSQSITIQKDSPIKRFKSVKKIPFSALKEIEIVDDSNEEGESWNIYLIQTYDDKPAHVYHTHKKSDAKSVAEKIHKITAPEHKYGISAIRYR